jgi:hypothetical protein
LKRDWIARHTISVPKHDYKTPLYKLMCGHGDATACHNLAEMSIQQHMQADSRAVHEMNHETTREHAGNVRTGTEHASSDSHAQAEKRVAENYSRDKKLCSKGDEGACRRVADSDVRRVMAHDRLAQRDMMASARGLTQSARGRAGSPEQEGGSRSAADDAGADEDDVEHHPSVAKLGVDSKREQRGRHVEEQGSSAMQHVSSTRPMSSQVQQDVGVHNFTC